MECGDGMDAKSFLDLRVHQKSHEFVLAVYRMTASFPRDELFGLTSQLRRAAVSIPANIAEGFIKRGRADKLRFYNIAQGSAEECRYYLILTKDLGYADTSSESEILQEVCRMLNAYVNAIASERR